jgi:hypothetical protein
MASGHDNRAPLDYETPRRPARAQFVIDCIGGVGIGVALIAFVGFLGGFSILAFPGTQGLQTWRARVTAVWAAIALLAAMGAVRNFRRRRPFLAGILIGGAFTALCEGICYAPR